MLKFIVIVVILSIMEVFLLKLFGRLVSLMSFRFVLGRDILLIKVSFE